MATREMSPSELLAAVLFYVGLDRIPADLDKIGQAIRDAGTQRPILGCLLFGALELETAISNLHMGKLLKDEGADGDYYLWTPNPRMREYVNRQILSCFYDAEKEELQRAADLIRSSFEQAPLI